jgi:hypothetical protein
MGWKNERLYAYQAAAGKTEAAPAKLRRASTRNASAPQCLNKAQSLTIPHQIALRKLNAGILSSQ